MIENILGSITKELLWRTLFEAELCPHSYCGASQCDCIWRKIKYVSNLMGIYRVRSNPKWLPPNKKSRLGHSYQEGRPWKNYEFEAKKKGMRRDQLWQHLISNSQPRKLSKNEVLLCEPPKGIAVCYSRPNKLMQSLYMNSWPQWTLQDREIACLENQDLHVLAEQKAQRWKKS